MFARFFVDRPVFATVLSLVIVILGGVAFVRLPIAQYPEVAPPTIVVTAVYPGADAQTVADTVATPIEQEVNGVERMLYLKSKCTNDGQMTLEVTFELGTDLDMAQVLVQNRVSTALPRLPEEVRRTGVTTKKRSPSILLCINLLSARREDGSYFYDPLYLSNYATLSIKDDLARVRGVGDVSFLGGLEYSMRVWLDTNKLAALGLTAAEVIAAIREQNVQVAAGRLGQPPLPSGTRLPYQLPILVEGRLSDEAQFGAIVLRRGEAGQLVYLRDVVAETRPEQVDRGTAQGIELGAKSYEMNSYLDGEPTVTLAVFQQPGSNALATAEAVKAKMEELQSRFPRRTMGGAAAPALEYKIVYDTTIFVDESIHEVYNPLLEAFVLVFLVVLVFLQDWRATLLPMIDVPVSLIGTFAVMALLGFSLNNLTLFGLVLAIGIVVDDAIVVVENVERWMAKGLPPREATIKAMEEITGPVIAITLVLSSVFIPTAFLAGITGQFYRQFALTIAAATIISAINAMTMAPARAVVLIRPHTPGHGTREVLPRWGVALLLGLAGAWGLGTGFGRMLEGVGLAAPLVWARVLLMLLGAAAGWWWYRPLHAALAKFLEGFNRAFDALAGGYGRAVRRLIRFGLVGLLVYAGLLAGTVGALRWIPRGFIPEQDKGYLIAEAVLPDGAGLQRTQALVAEMAHVIRQTPGVAHTIELPGYSTLLGANLSNCGGMFVILEPFEERAGDHHRSAPVVAMALRKKLAALQDARIVVFNAPPVEGVGNTGGIKGFVQDRGSAGLSELQAATQGLAARGMQQPALAGMFSNFSVAQPQLRLEIDREKAKAQGVSLNDIYSTLQAGMGATYVNDFTFQNRNWQVNVQADPQFRLRTEDIGRLEVRNARGARVPLGTLVEVQESAGPAIVNHYNLYPAAEISGVLAPGVSSGDAIALVGQLAQQQLPTTMGYEWTELSLQEVLAAADALSKFIFPLAVLFVFLVLAAQYESWSLPLAILLIIPMCVLAAMLGVWMVRLDNNIFVQIGLVVLIGLAAKNAILLVEFSKQLEDAGQSRIQAVVEACRVRLRPILMTSLAFILGVVPLVLSHGAGAEMRFALGVAVLSGMFGVTIFGLAFTPIFYDVVRRLVGTDNRSAAAADTSAAEATAAPPSGN